MVTRRQFLKTGLVGSMALAAVGAWYWHRRHGVGRSGRAAVLDADGRAIVAAVAPLLLAGALPEGAARNSAIVATVDGVERAIGGLGAAAQEEVGNLFALLGFAPTRVLVAGVLHPWAKASGEEIASFLTAWRFSRFQLLQSGYAALHDLVLGAWYGNPDSWPAIDYPGPPEVS